MFGLGTSVIKTLKNLFLFYLGEIDQYISLMANKVGKIRGMAGGKNEVLKILVLLNARKSKTSYEV